MFGLFDSTDEVSPLSAPQTLDTWLSAADGDVRSGASADSTTILPRSNLCSTFYTEKYKPLWELEDALSVPVCAVSYRENFHTLWPELLKVLADFPDLSIEIIHGLYPGSLLADGNRVVIPETALELVRTYDVYVELLPWYREGTYGPHEEVIKLRGTY